MGDVLRKFVNRAPRYVLRPNDRNNMRFCLEHSVGDGGIEETILINLSETGAAFLMTPGAEPHLGDRIKVEIPIPGDEQIAWWGSVMHIENYEPRGWTPRQDRFRTKNRILVGLKFEKLPQPHTRAIRNGLNRSFMQAMRDQQYRTWLYYRNSFVEHTGKVVLYIALTAALVWFIYKFTRGDENYDPQRGAPWGERFKF